MEQCKRSSNPVFRPNPIRRRFRLQAPNDLYKELRIENTLTDADGNEVRLKVGAKVELTVEAEPQGVITSDSKD